MFILQVKKDMQKKIYLVKNFKIGFNTLIKVEET